MAHLASAAAVRRCKLCIQVCLPGKRYDKIYALYAFYHMKKVNMHGMQEEVSIIIVLYKSFRLGGHDLHHEAS